MASKILEARNEMDTKRKALADMFAGKPDLDFTSEEVEDIRRKNAELSDLGAKYDVLAEVEAIASRTKAAQELARQAAPTVPFQTGAGDPANLQTMWQNQPQRKSIGRQFVEHGGYTNSEHSGKSVRFSVDMDKLDLTEAFFKATLTETSFVPANPRTNILIPSAQRRLVVADLIPQTTTTLQIINYMRETTFTNNAATVAEGATKPESALAYTQIASPVQKIATTLPLTEEVLDDVPSMESMVNDRLSLMIQLEEEVELLSGSGTPPDLTGFYNTSGIQTQAKSTDPAPDAAYKAMTLVRNTVGFADPSAWIFHPTDWQNIKLLRTTTGEYIWGNPADMGPDRLWGLPVVQTIAATLGTGLTGDFRMYSHISRRMGLRIDVGFINDDFTKNLLRLRAEERLSLEVYRPTAFCTVTGL